MDVYTSIYWLIQPQVKPQLPKSIRTTPDNLIPDSECLISLASPPVPATDSRREGKKLRGLGE